jgi:hypothetical protein
MNRYQYSTLAERMMQCGKVTLLGRRDTLASQRGNSGTGGKMKVKKCDSSTK